jgi:hypothetical protein
MLINIFVWFLNRTELENPEYPNQAGVTGRKILLRKGEYLVKL